MKSRYYWISVQIVRILSLRFLYALVTLVFVVFVTFVIDAIAPGGPEYAIVGEKGTAEAYARVRHELGRDRPWPERFANYLADVFQLKLGNSYYGTKEPVLDIVKTSILMTARIATICIVLASIIGILLGVLGAVYQNTWVDKLVLTISTFGVTIPNFVLAPVLAYFFAIKLDLLPLTWEVHRVLPDFYYLVLPVTILALRPGAMITRLTRATMTDTLQQEFIRFATAKGIPSLRIIFRHGLRNAILPVITGIGFNYGFLLTGAFIVEQIFTIPGIGQVGIEAILQRNTPVIEGTVLVTAALFIFINLLVDIALPFLDPRIREAHA